MSFLPFSLKLLAAIALIADESSPPDKKVQRGTSPTNCLCIASINNCLVCSIASSAFSLNSSALTVQYSHTLILLFLSTRTQFAGATSFISLYTALPGIVAGPSANISVKPSIFTSLFIFG